MSGRDGKGRGGATAWSALAAAPALIALWVHASSYLPFIADDALISLRYARRLLDGHGLTWTDGQVVEGYSNLLWVLLCAAGGAVGLDLIFTARLLGFAASSLALLAVVRAVRPRGLGELFPAVASSLALALCGPMAVWTVGGLEQPLLACLLAWALVLSYPLLETDDPPVATAWVAPGALLALICWTRPDGPLFTVGVCAGLVAARGLDRATLGVAARVALLPVAATLTQQGFRLAYYREWLPNTAHAKVSFTARRAGEGLRYLGRGFLPLIAFLAPALAVAGMALGDREAGRRVRLLAAPLLIWCAYLIVIGGDIFPAERHLVPVVVILALLLAEGLRALVRRRGAMRAVGWAALVALAAALLAMQAFDAQNRRARRERWEWDGQAVGELLKTAFGDRRPLLAADPAGTLPYFSELPSIDMLGLNDHHIARHRPEGFGSGPLGHELGDGTYVLDQRPDLVVFCGPGGSLEPCFQSGKEMFADPRFRQGYRPVQVRAEDPHRVDSVIWFRTEGGRIGVERRPGRVSVPGYLLANRPANRARLEPAGGLAIEVSPGASAVYTGLVLEPGQWRLGLDHEGGRPVVAVRSRGDGRIIAEGSDGLWFQLDGPAPRVMDLQVRSDSPEPTLLRRITLLGPTH